MVKITTDFSGGETIATTKTRLEAILDYWLGTSSTSGVSTWGGLRTLLNSVAPSVVTIADGEIASVFRPKINSLNDPDGIISSTLFGSSEPGVWYDPSDLTTLFQDVAGTTPVTTAGQTVGLMLDKSQGLALGAELATNGGFDTDTDWLYAAWAISGGLAVASAVVAYSSISLHAVPFVAGRSYVVTYTVVSADAGNVRVSFSGGVQVSGTTRTTAGTFTEILVANTGNSQLNIQAVNLGFTGSIDNITVKLLPGNHATQATAAARPTYQTDGTLHWLSFDGVDDFMVTPTITPGINKVQVFTGVRKLSDATTGVVIELSVSSSAKNGTLALFGPISAGINDNFTFRSKGSIAQDAFATGNAAPSTSVITGLGNISGDSSAIRDDGVVSSIDTGDQGTGNYLAYPMYIGMRAGISLPFNGNIYGLVTRFGANLGTTTIRRTETYVAGKTGVTL